MCVATTLPCWQLLELGEIGDAILEELEQLVYVSADEVSPGPDPRIGLAARIKARTRRRR